MFERSTLQLMSILVNDEDNDKINSLGYTSKTHLTLEEKKLIPLCAKHLHFLIKRTGWLVTSIYEYQTFEQYTFKRDFVIVHLQIKVKSN